MLKAKSLRFFTLYVIYLFIITTFFSPVYAASSYRDVVMSDSPWIFWRLGETSGTTAVDETGTHDGTYAGSITKGVSGALLYDSNTAISLSGGTTQYVYATSLNDFPSTALTVEFWMNSSNTTKKGTPFSYGVSAEANAFALFDYTGFDVVVMGKSTDTAKSANDGQWHHIVVTWQSSDGASRLYKDGIQIWSGTVAAGYTITGGGIIDLAQEQDVAGGNFDGTQAFAGTLDEVAVYNYVLGADRVLIHYESGRSDTDSDTIPDGYDNCRGVSNSSQLDTDVDGVGDACDRCVTVSDPLQTDTDNDLAGDACDSDDDGDGVMDSEDNCSLIANSNQDDNEFDGVGDYCDDDDDNDTILDVADNCSLNANSSQQDSDLDGPGDVCDDCPFDADNDEDNDGVCGDVDTCPGQVNLLTDYDEDGFDDVCDAEINCDLDDYSDQVLTDAPILYWRLGEPLGSTAADAADNILGTYAGAITFAEPSGLLSSHDYSVQLHGNTSQYISANVSTFPTASISVEFWIKSSDTTDAAAVFSYATSANSDAFVVRDYNDFDIVIMGSALDTNVSVTDGQWHHIVATWNSADGNTRIYKDGSKLFEGTRAVGQLLGSSGTIVLGQDQDCLGGCFSTSQAFEGSLDEVALYPTVLSETVIHDHFIAGRGDSDLDGIGEVCDNCPLDANSDQVDTDGNGIGNVCEGDTDQDGYGDVLDNCPLDPNTDQLDTDFDDEGDACDLCPFDALNDEEGDGYCADEDSCPTIFNSEIDHDRDAIDDICDPDISCGFERFEDAVRADDPVAYWRLHEDSGASAPDEIGLNSATYIGSMTKGVGGALLSDYNHAVTLSGITSQYILRSGFSGFPATQISLEVWMKSNDTDESGTPFSYATTSTADSFVLFNYRSFDIVVMDQTIDTGVSAVDGQWHHIVATWSSSSGAARLYKDGALAFSGTVGTGLTIPDSGAAVLGQEQDSVGGSFSNSQAHEGSLDEVAIYDTVLTPERVLQHFLAGRFDTDVDQVFEACDLCPDDYNPGQENVDQDPFGDICDNCPQRLNPDQVDLDEDGVGDPCDRAPADADPTNVLQSFTDGATVIDPDQTTELETPDGLFFLTVPAGYIDDFATVSVVWTPGGGGDIELKGHPGYSASDLLLGSYEVEVGGQDGQTFANGASINVAVALDALLQDVSLSYRNNSLTVWTEVDSDGNGEDDAFQAVSRCTGASQSLCFDLDLLDLNGNGSAEQVLLTLPLSRL